VKKKVSLREFVKEDRTKGGLPCSTCLLPKETLREIHLAYKRGTARRVIWRWLSSVKLLSITDHAFGNHFRNYHHMKNRGTK